jgi:hypothetical protein
MLSSSDDCVKPRRSPESPPGLGFGMEVIGDRPRMGGAGSTPATRTPACVDAIKCRIDLELDVVFELASCDGS